MNNSIISVMAAGTSPRRDFKALTVVNATGYNGGGISSWFGTIAESFAGAFQQNVRIDSQRNILAFSAVFSCITGIASDVAKLRINLVEEDEDGICKKADPKSPFWAVLKKPNRFQNRIKFIEQWIVSKLLYGNTYILKERDGRGVVTALYVLDGQRVKTLVTDSGDVYYEIMVDALSGVYETIAVPASEIIHDMMVSLWHPLVGVSPIYACGMSATMGNRIQSNSTQFFNNMSRPSGMLTAPAAISDEVGQRLKKAFEDGFSLGNLGRLFVAGDGLKYEPMTIPAQDAQLIEQLKWTVEDVGRCYHYPDHKLGINTGKSTLSIEAQEQAYYNDCLQILFESIELCLDEGLNLPSRYHTESDLDGLLRMDTAARYEALGKVVGSGIMSPNEARAKEDLAPVPGGETPYLQQQNYGLAALAKRDAKEDPFASSVGKTTSAAPVADDSAANDAANALYADTFSRILNLDRAAA